MAPCINNWNLGWNICDINYLPNYFKIKKKVVSVFFFSLVIIILFLSFSSASNVGLIENEVWQSGLTAARFSAVVLGDLDGDNDKDMISFGCTSGGGYDCAGAIAKVYINNGTTFNVNSTWQNNLTPVGGGSLNLGDIDNDGDLDLILSGCDSTSSYVCNSESNIFTKVYINNGTTLNENTIWQENITKIYRSSSSLGDIDNDGDLDLVMHGAGFLSKFSKVYINNGTSFIESTQWQGGLDATFKGQIALGDIDNDGDLDLAMSGENTGGSNYINFYINNGSSFVGSNQWNQNLIPMDRSPLAFIDYNNDNFLDLMVCGQTAGDYCYLYKNTGSTLEINQTRDDGFLGIFRATIAFGDYDNDGDLDYVGGGRESGYTRILENNESNNYYFQDDPVAHSNLSNTIYAGSSFVWSDVDEDKDLDLILIGIDFATTYVAKIFINNNTVSNTLPNASTSDFSSTYSNNVLTLGWGNGSDAETTTLGLYYNLMVGNSTTNHTIVSGIYGGTSGGGGSGGGGASGYFGNMMQRQNISLNVELDGNKTYYWYVQTIDTGLATSNWSVVQSFTTANDTTKPNITLHSPENNIYKTNASFIFNISVTDLNMSNVTLYANFNGTMIANETNSSGVSGNYIFEKNLSSKNDGVYLWYIYACDGEGNCQTSSTRSFYLDRAYPVVTLISPADDASQTSSSIVVFSYNVSDTDVANCSLIIDGSVDQTETSITENTTQTFTKTMSNADYTWKVDCTDYVNYTGNSSEYSLTVNYVVSSNNNGSSSGGNGGGGGFWISSYSVSDSDFEKGFSRELAKKYRLRIKINNTYHYVGVVNLTDTTAVINITSNPIQIVLDVEGEAKLELTNDSFYDLLVRLNGIVDDKANISVMKIYEEIPVGEEKVSVSGGEIIEDGTGVEKVEKGDLMWLWIIIGIIVILVAVIVIVIIKFKGRKLWGKK